MTKNIKFMIFIIVISSVTIIISCKKHKSATNVGACDPSVIYFNKNVMPIINSNCTMSGCHTGKIGDNFSLTSYYAVMKYVSAGKANGSSLYESITTTKERKMPPNGSLTDNQIKTIYDWITQGASNEICNDGSSCDTSNIKFSTTINNLLTDNCNGCHSGSGASGGVDLTSYSGVNAQAINGKLMGTINFSTGYKQMPPSGSQLSACDRAKIQQWITNGHLNN